MYYVLRPLVIITSVNVIVDIVIVVVVVTIILWMSSEIESISMVGRKNCCITAGVSTPQLVACGFPIYRSTSLSKITLIYR
jgi:hypothetical protein